MIDIAAVFHTDGSLPECVGPQPHGGSSLHPWVPLLTCTQGVYVSAVPAGRLTIVCDARIDNRPELAAQLGEQVGAGDGPAALIAAAWLKWGRDCATHLQGDFAFILWDQLLGMLYAARDTMGMRPLYYALGKGFICLSTSPRMLLRHSRVGSDLSRTALLMWVLNRYEDRFSMFEDIQGLARGHYLATTREKTEVVAYWNPIEVPRLHYVQESDYHHHFRELLARCVADRCNTARPVVASMLSGGMDSSSITALAQQSCRATNKEIHALSFHFQTLTACNESELSHTIADWLKVPCELIDCESFWPLQGAFGDGALLNTPFRCWDPLNDNIFERVKDKGADVLLTGHGGDAMMIGLGRISSLSARVLSGRLSAAKPLWQAIRATNSGLGEALFRHLLLPALPEAMKRGFKRACGYTSGRLPWVPAEHYRRYGLNRNFFTAPARDGMDWERHYLWQIIDNGAYGVRRAIHLLNRLARPHGISVRHPFCDRRLAEFMLAIPTEKIRYHPDYVGQKGFLRKSMQGLLPEAVLDFSAKVSLAPYYYFGLSRERDNIEKLFVNSELAALGLIDPHLLRQGITAYLDKSPNATHANFFTTIVTEIWLQNEKGV